MSDIELVIKLPEEMYKWVNDVNKFFDDYGISDFIDLVEKGTPLPKGHGDLIDKDHMIARLEAASKFYGGENADAFDERFSYGLKEAAIKVAEEPTIIEANKESEVQE